MKDLQRLLSDRKITLDLTERARRAILEAGYDRAYGARPLRRAIQRLIQDKLAVKILEGSVLHGDHVVVDGEPVDAGALSFTVTPAHPLLKSISRYGHITNARSQTGKGPGHDVRSLIYSKGRHPIQTRSPSMPKTAIIVGAGPAGLTAALEFVRRSDIRPVVLEASEEIGGISRTIRYKGNRMGYRGPPLFLKEATALCSGGSISCRRKFPVERRQRSTYQGQSTTIRGHVKQESVPRTAPRRSSRPHGNSRAGTYLCSRTLSTTAHTESAGSVPGRDEDLVMLIRPRKSRIYYLRRFFDYPIKLSLATLSSLGMVRTLRVAFSYVWSRFHQIQPERSLEDFLINHFGRELYQTFFKSYTEKVWGTPCHEISAEWGAQRIKGLSLTTAIKHFVTQRVRRSGVEDLSQKRTDTSLIERFLYPKFGPGQLWEHVAELVQKSRGEVCLGWKVDRIHCEEKDGRRRVLWVEAFQGTGERRRFEGDYFFSTMPIQELIPAIDFPVPANVREVSDGLQYRDFITVGLLADRLKVREADGGLLKDTWIYVQEPDVLLGRLQIFNNWSPYLVADAGKVWLGLEYFCYQTDPLWNMTDEGNKSIRHPGSGTHRHS